LREECPLTTAIALCHPAESSPTIRGPVLHRRRPVPQNFASAKRTQNPFIFTKHTDTPIAASGAIPSSGL
jgi:hypothetical protein